MKQAINFVVRLIVFILVIFESHVGQILLNDQEMSSTSTQTMPENEPSPSPPDPSTSPPPPPFQTSIPGQPLSTTRSNQIGDRSFASRLDRFDTSISNLDSVKLKVFSMFILYI